MLRMAGLFGVVIAAVLFAPVAIAKNDDLEKRSEPVTREALSALQAGDPQRALTLVEPVIAEFEKANAGKGQIFCAETMAEVAFYAATAGAVPESAGQARPDSSTKIDKGNVIVVNSSWCVAQYARAFALVDLKRLDEAQSGFERLVQFAPRRSRYLNELGFVLQRKRQWQASIDAYNRADSAADVLEPGDRNYERCVALRGLGYDLVELGRLDDAESAYRKCLAIIPNEPKSLGEIEYINQQRRKTT